VRLGILDPQLNLSEVGMLKIYENMQTDDTMPPDLKFDIRKVVDHSYLRAAQAGAR
jgi:hypothetical protein